MASNDPEHRDEEEAGEAAGDDEDTGAQVAPIIKLEEVAVTTGEEDEEVLLDLKAKLYRFDKDGNQWKERGVGTVKLLKHKETGKEHAGNDKSCVWHATDFSDGELKEELFCIRFGSVENCKHFMGMVEEIAESQGIKVEENKDDAESTTQLFKKLDVSEGQKPEAAAAAREKKEEESKKAEPETEKKDTEAASASS